MAEHSFDAWLEEAVGQMKFWPDRAAVRQELLDHLEDHREALIAGGMDAEQAARMAVGSMGSAVQIGRQLNRVHRPWLGFAWLISKLLCILSMVLAGWALLINPMRPEGVLERLTEDYLELDGCCSALSEGFFPGYAKDCVPVVSGLSQRAGDYTVTLEHGEYYVNNEGGAPSEYLNLCFWVRGDTPWLTAPLGLESKLVIEDDRGGLHKPTGRSRLTMELEGGVPGLWKAHLRLFIPKDGDPTPWEWFRISVEDTQVDFTVHTNGEVEA